MLGMKTYTQQYVDACRRRVETQIAAYQALADTSKDGPGEKPLATFAPIFFNNMVLVLEASFVHRLRAVEGKDGNPLNEVRALCTSLLENDGVLEVDTSIKLRPETSVLGLHRGDTIALGEADFVKLADAFFTEIATRFVP